MERWGQGTEAREASRIPGFVHAGDAHFEQLFKGGAVPGHAELLENASLLVPQEENPLARTESDLAFYYGLDASMAEALTARSADKEGDPGLFRYVDDGDAFSSPEACLAWAGGKDVFVCTTGTGGLAALVWLTPKPLPITLPEGESLAEVAPEAWDAMSFRSYPPYRGRGIMQPFGSEVVAWHDAYRSGRALWLQVDAEFTPAQVLYTELGFRPVGDLYTTYRDEERRKLIMVHDGATDSVPT